MNFHKRTHDVVSGRITQFRQPVAWTNAILHRHAETGDTWTAPVLRAAPRTGSTFVVKRADTTPAVYAAVLDVDRQWLGAIDHAGARACGYRTTDDFKVEWTRRVDRIPASAERWAVREFGDDGLRDLLLARFTRHHAATEVWVVTFQISEDPVRFLAAGSRGGDYTSTPARALDTDAPCVGDLELARYAKKAQAHRTTQQESFAEDLANEREKRRKMRLSMFRDAA